MNKLFSKGLQSLFILFILSACSGNQKEEKIEKKERLVDTSEDKPKLNVEKIQTSKETPKKKKEEALGTEKATALDIDEKQSDYTSDELIKYMKNSKFFDHTVVKKGTFFYRCVSDEEEAKLNTNYPLYFARSAVFAGFFSPLCAYTPVRKYEAIKDFKVTDFRANINARQWPNHKKIENIKMIDPKIQNSDELRIGHILDLSLSKFLEAPNALKLTSSWPAKGNKRVYFFCNYVVDASSEPIGWFDYDFGFDRVNHEKMKLKPKNEESPSRGVGSTDTHEMVLCNPRNVLKLVK